MKTDFFLVNEGECSAQSQFAFQTVRGWLEVGFGDEISEVMFVPHR